MICDGTQEVFSALKEKRRLMQEQLPHEHIQPLLIFGGGLMKGAYGVGAAIALEELGYKDVFSSVVGVSSGAPTAAHFIAGTASKGASVITQECCTRRFANPWRFWNQVDTEYFMDIMRNDEVKRVDAAAVLSKKTKLYFGVSQYKTGEPKLLQPKDEDTFFKAMHASLTMQNVSRHKTFIDGVQYADGGFTKPHILQEVIDTIPATHILYITNNDRVFGSISAFEQMLNRTLFRLRLNGAQIVAINGRREERDKAILSLWTSGTPSVVIWGDGSVGSMDRNAERLSAAIETSRVWWHGLLSE